VRIVFVAVPDDLNARHITLLGAGEPDLSDVVETRRARDRAEQEAILTQLRDLE
jgi:hypothetical protein